MDRYIVLIGDIEDSQELENSKRKAVQEELKKVLEELNEEDQYVLSPYTVTLGDEFQAVLGRADELFTCAWKILARLYPVKVRFSLGIGGLSTSVNRKQALGMDGPAFHEARKGIERLKKNGFLFNLAVRGEERAVINVLNDSLYLLSGQIRGWNKNRLSMMYMLRQGKGYKEIAKELDISEQAFYKNKEAASLDVVLDLCDNIAEIINNWAADELSDISYAAEPDSDFKA